MGDNLIGKWKLETSENFEEFMKALGVGMVMRKLGGASKPMVTISKEGDEWSVKTETTFKTTELKFKLDEEFEEERMDGTKCKTLVKMDGGKLTQKQAGEKEVNIVREVVNGDLHVVCSCRSPSGEVTSTRIYKKI